MTLATLKQELEELLLVHYGQMHAESGKHVRILSTWQNWCVQNSFRSKPTPYEQALKRIETHVAELNRKFGAGAELPWLKASQKRKRLIRFEGIPRK